MTQINIEGALAPSHIGALIEHSRAYNDPSDLPRLYKTMKDNLSQLNAIKMMQNRDNFNIAEKDNRRIVLLIQES